MPFSSSAEAGMIKCTLASSCIPSRHLNGLLIILGHGACLLNPLPKITQWMKPNAVLLELSLTQCRNHSLSTMYGVFSLSLGHEGSLSGKLAFEVGWLASGVFSPHKVRTWILLKIKRRCAPLFFIFILEACGLHSAYMPLRADSLVHNSYLETGTVKAIQNARIL